jgi:hypothetical protein
LRTLVIIELINVYLVAFVAGTSQFLARFVGTHAEADAFEFAE